MLELYPECEPYKTHRLQVSKIHNLYVEEVGNPHGQPVLFLHGGPGTGIGPKNRRYFDANHYRIVLFDQRGAGMSTPHASMEENTTWDLIADIEKIRQHLRIQSWLVFGGSWGATLGLAYAQQHPQNVTGLILRGIFLSREEELRWFYQQGCDLIFPDFYAEYISLIPPAERGDMMKAYYKRLTNPDINIQSEAAKAWAKWEASTLCLIPNPDEINFFTSDQVSISVARLECHYFINRCFFPEDGYLLKNINKVRNVKARLIHGRYDVVCPVKNSWLLHQSWPESELEIIKDAGHLASEPSITQALLRATEDFKQ